MNKEHHQSSTEQHRLRRFNAEPFTIRLQLDLLSEQWPMERCTCLHISNTPMPYLQAGYQASVLRHIVGRTANPFLHREHLLLYRGEDMETGKWW